MGEKKSLRYALWNSIDIASIKFNLSYTKNSSFLDNSLNKIFNWLMKKVAIKNLSLELIKIPINKEKRFYYQVDP